MKDLIEWLSQQVGQAQRDLAQHDHGIPKPRHVGPPFGNQNDSLARVVLQLIHPLPKMTTGGKA